MRLPGFCTECSRFTQVSVSGSALATAMARGRTTPEGTCTSCERKRDCKHTRNNDTTGARTVRCLDCNTIGHRNRGGEIVWT